jgi:hypothetical protein
MMGINFIQATVRHEEGPVVSGMLLEEGFEINHPEEILKYYGKDLDVMAEIKKNPEGVEAVAFRVVR